MATEIKVHRRKSTAVMHKETTQSSTDAADSSSDETSYEQVLCGSRNSLSF